MPGHTNARTRSASEAVAEVLAAHPETATGAELATAAGVGQSTATKALAALEAEGRARRLPGGRGQNGRRQPDRWSPPEPPAAAVDQEPSPDPDPRPDPEPQPEKAPPAAGRKAGRRPGDEYIGARLGRGELAGLVLDYMADRPSETVGPASVAKGLGRSAGAVSNALGRLAEAGTVRLVGESPRRYRLARR